MYWKYFCCNSSIRIAYKWHHSHISLCISQTGTTQTAGARNKGGNFIGQLCISVVPHSSLCQKCSSFWKCLDFGIHLLTVAPSVRWYLWFGKPCWKWSQRFPGNKISFTYYHFQQNNFHEIYIFLFSRWTIKRLFKAIAWNWYSVRCKDQSNVDYKQYNIENSNPTGHKIYSNNRFDRI